MTSREAHPAETALIALGVQPAHAAFVLGDSSHGACVLGDRSASGSRSGVDAQATGGQQTGPRTGHGHAGYAGDSFDPTGMGGE